MYVLVVCTSCIYLMYNLVVCTSCIYVLVSTFMY